MNKHEITSILKDLYMISGFRISLHGVNYENIAAYPEEKSDFCRYIQQHGVDEIQKCVACDSEACKRALTAGETIVYKCRHGLVEAICPLYSFGSLTGYVLMGQVRERGADMQRTVSVLEGIGVDRVFAKNLCDNIPQVSKEMIEPLVRITTMCAKYLTISNAIPTTKLTIGQMAMKYISENYTRQVSINDICNETGYSKSTVLSAFKREFGCTINQRLNALRLMHAKKLLDEGNLTINEIALATGFTNQSYFSKVFSAKYGVSPSDYRKDERQ